MRLLRAFEKSTPEPCTLDLGPSWQALDRLEMARFTRRYPQLLDPLLKQMLGMVAVRFPNSKPAWSCPQSLEALTVHMLGMVAYAQGSACRA